MVKGKYGVGKIVNVFWVSKLDLMRNRRKALINRSKQNHLDYI